jgi:hypothetical protein
MYSQWLRTEHDRLHIVEQWPDSPHKLAVLTAIRSSLASLIAKAPSAVCLECETCLNQHSSQAAAKLRVLTSAIESSSTVLAA